MRNSWPAAGCAVLVTIGCGSRGDVDLLGGGVGHGPQGPTDGSPTDGLVQPMDAFVSPDRGQGGMDASLDVEAIDATTRDEGAPPDRGDPDSTVDVDLADTPTVDASDAGISETGVDSGRCDGGLLCGAQCVNPLTDNDHCGTCNFKCNLFEQGGTVLGGCSNGLCAGAYGACFAASTPFFTCDEVCAKEGQVCIQAGCMGFTPTEYTFLDGCESKQVMEIHTNEACNQPMQLAAGYRAGRCCCAKRPGERR